MYIQYCKYPDPTMILSYQYSQCSALGCFFFLLPFSTLRAATTPRHLSAAMLCCSQLFKPNTPEAFGTTIPSHHDLLQTRHHPGVVYKNTSAECQ